MGMLGGFYVTSRASRCASTPAFWFSSCVRFRITFVLGNVCSQFKIHSRLCFGSMSCRGFQFFGFPCLRFLSSLLSRFFQSVLSSPVSSLVQNLLELFSLRFSVFSLSFSISVSVPPSRFFGSSISYSNSGSSLSLRYSVKVVHVFVSARHVVLLVFVKAALVRRKSVSLKSVSQSVSVVSSTPRFRTQIPVRLCPCTV